MGKLDIKRFGSPDFLRNIKPATLRTLLLKFEDFFKDNGFEIPDGDFTDAQMERLAGILVAPPSTIPSPLLDAVEMLESLTSEDGWLELQTLAPELVREVREEEDSAADIAVKIWLRNPTVIERIFTRISLDRKRTMVSYVPTKAVTPATPTRRVCRAIEHELSLSFADLFDTAACEVQVFEEPGGHALLIRHGEIVKRMGVLDDNGRPETKAIRPLKHDVAFLNSNGEFQVSGRGTELQNTYRRVFSTHLFGGGEVLQPFHRFSLEPLRTGRRCLDCPDLDEILGSSLRELHLRRKNRTCTTIHKANDVFAEIEAQGGGYLEDYELVRARFQLRAKGRRRTLNITVSPETDALGGDSHDPLARQWLDVCKIARHHQFENAMAHN